MSDKCLDAVECRGILYDGFHYFLCSTVPLDSQEQGSLSMYSKGKYCKKLCVLSKTKILIMFFWRYNCDVLFSMFANNFQ